jgi:hypothetical protein
MRVLCMYALCCRQCSRCQFSSVEKVWVGKFDSCATLVDDRFLPRIVAKSFVTLKVLFLLESESYATLVVSKQ